MPDLKTMIVNPEVYAGPSGSTITGAAGLTRKGKPMSRLFCTIAAGQTSFTSGSSTSIARKDVLEGATIYSVQTNDASYGFNWSLELVNSATGTSNKLPVNVLDGRYRLKLDFQRAGLFDKIASGVPGFTVDGFNLRYDQQGRQIFMVKNVAQYGGIEDYKETAVWLRAVGRALVIREWRRTYQEEAGYHAYEVPRLYWASLFGVDSYDNEMVALGYLHVLRLIDQKDESYANLWEDRMNDWEDGPLPTQVELDAVIDNDPGIAKTVYKMLVALGMLTAWLPGGQLMGIAPLIVTMNSGKKASTVLKGLNTIFTLTRKANGSNVISTIANYALTLTFDVLGKKLGFDVRDHEQAFLDFINSAKKDGYVTSRGQGLWDLLYYVTIAPQSSKNAEDAVWTHLTFIARIFSIF